ncbi:MAG: outer membrane lipoprotein-sorting protein [Planctomycetaceae bacterium]|nr:outer membrane lipoprotein-sorting protein [Planctomycetaceae bacterium]
MTLLRQYLIVIAGIILLLFMPNLNGVQCAEDKILTVADILDGIKKSKSLFFNSDNFLVKVEITKCEEITPNRYSGGYFNTEFIVAKKGSMWFTSKKFTHIGQKNKDGKNIIKQPDGKGGVWVPLESEINIVKNHLVFEWDKNDTAASVRQFTNGGNMHQCNVFFRQLGWDLSRVLIESEGKDYDSIRDKENWLLDYLDHPFLPEFLENNLSKYSIISKKEDVDGFSCWVIEYSGMDKIWIDSDHGYVVRKRTYHWGAGSARKFTIHNKDFREIKPGIWLPYRQIVDKYASIISEDKKIWDKVAARIYYETKEVILDNVPEEVFNIELNEGLRIIDNVRDTIYTITKPNSDPFAGHEKQEIEASGYVIFRAILIISGSILALIGLWLILRKEKE